MPDFYFRHKDIFNQTFLHPIPIPKRPFVPRVESWTQYLYFHTRECRLRFRLPVSKEWFNGEVYLHDANSCIVGLLTLNKAPEPTTVFGLECKLIAISKGASWHSTEEKGIARKTPYKVTHNQLLIRGCYEYYNVL